MMLSAFTASSRAKASDKKETTIANIKVKPIEFRYSLDSNSIW